MRGVGSGQTLAAAVLILELASCARGTPKPPTRSGCPSELRLLLGACVSPAVASQACGASALATLDGCVPRAPCESGRARDLDTGECLPRRDTRAIATSAGILVAEDQIVACPTAAGQLTTGTVEAQAAAGLRIGCLPRGAASAPACPAGELMDAGRCVSFVEAGKIDLVRWLHGAIGADGGAGAPPLCRALAQSSGALGTVGLSEVRVEVALAFPDNDVTQVTAAIHGWGAGPAELERVLAPLIEALRSLGGTTSQASITAAVRCQRTSDRPAARQAGEGATEGAGEGGEPKLR